MENKMINEESPSLQAHLQIYQKIISRMASNSSAAKTWCITLVSAILVVVADKGKPDLALLALLPIVLFLDGYYLLIENRFRGTYNAFVKKLHEGQLTVEDLYAVQPDINSVDYVLKVVCSVSILPFYIGLGFMVGWAYCYVLV